MKKTKIHQDVYIGLFCLALVAWFFFLTRDLPFDSAFMPRMLSGLLGILALVLTIKGFQKSRSQENSDSKAYITADVIKVPFITWLFVAGYVALFLIAGYFVATAVMLVCLMRYMKRTSWKAIIAIVVIYLALVYIFFVKQFGLNLLNLGLIGKLF